MFCARIYTIRDQVVKQTGFVNELESSEHSVWSSRNSIGTDPRFLGLRITVCDEPIAHWNHDFLEREVFRAFTLLHWSLGEQAGRMVMRETALFVYGDHRIPFPKLNEAG